MMSSMDEEPIVSKKGYLSKEGGNFKNIRRRWFFLEGNILSYYTDRKAQIKNARPKGVVELKPNCVSLSVPEGARGRPYGIRIESPGRIFNIFASSNEEQLDWYHALTGAANRQRRETLRREKLYSQLGSSAQAPRPSAAFVAAPTDRRSVASVKPFVGGSITAQHLDIRALSPKRTSVVPDSTPSRTDSAAVQAVNRSTNHAEKLSHMRSSVVPAVSGPASITLLKTTPLAPHTASLQTISRNSVVPASTFLKSQSDSHVNRTSKVQPLDMTVIKRPDGSTLRVSVTSPITPPPPGVRLSVTDQLRLASELFQDGLITKEKKQDLKDKILAGDERTCEMLTHYLRRRSQTQQLAQQQKRPSNGRPVAKSHISDILEADEDNEDDKTVTKPKQKESDSDSSSDDNTAEVYSIYNKDTTKEMRRASMLARKFHELRVSDPRRESVRNEWLQRVSKILDQDVSMDQKAYLKQALKRGGETDMSLISSVTPLFAATAARKDSLKTNIESAPADRITEIAVRLIQKTSLLQLSAHELLTIVNKNGVDGIESELDKKVDLLDNHLNSLKEQLVKKIRYALKMHLVNKQIKANRYPLDVKDRFYDSQGREVWGVNRQTRVEIVIIPAVDSREELTQRSTTDPKTIHTLYAALERGQILLFNYHMSEDVYTYTIEDPLEVIGQRQDRTTLLKEYLTFRKQFPPGTPGEVFKAALPSFMKQKQEQYHTALAVVQNKYKDLTRIIVIRTQDEPEDNFQPPRFGDLVVIWCPTRDTSDVSFQERSLANPIVVGNLLTFLEKRNVLEKFNYRRDADTTEQGSDQPLDYDIVFRKLFQKATIT